MQQRHPPVTDGQGGSPEKTPGVGERQGDCRLHLVPLVRCPIRDDLAMDRAPIQAQSGRGQIGVVNADGSAQRHLTDSPGFDVSPA
jgi:hypothetical protein